MKPLEMQTSLRTEVAFHVEYDKLSNRDPACFISVTLSTDESSWGEFLTRDQALSLIGWLFLVVGNG